LEKYVGAQDAFTHYRVDEQIAKALDRKVYLPSGGSLVIDRTEAMTVVDVNTGKFIGQGGNLEETVTQNNLEAAEEIVRQLRLRDIGGIIVIDFIDMVLESNRDQVIRRLIECLGRDRTKHQVAEVTSLGLVQMTRKRIGAGLLEVFGQQCDHCNGRGVTIHMDGNTSGKSNRADQGGHDHGRPGKSRKAEKSEVQALETPKPSSDSVEESENVEENKGKSSNDRPKRGRRSASRPAGQPVFDAGSDLTV
jgi:ribonuclease E